MYSINVTKAVGDAWSHISGTRAYIFFSFVIFFVLAVALFVTMGHNGRLGQMHTTVQPAVVTMARTAAGTSIAASKSAANATATSNSQPTISFSALASRYAMQVSNVQRMSLTWQRLVGLLLMSFIVIYWRAALMGRYWQDKVGWSSFWSVVKNTKLYISAIIFFFVVIAVSKACAIFLPVHIGVRWTSIVSLLISFLFVPAIMVFCGYKVAGTNVGTGEGWKLAFKQMFSQYGWSWIKVLFMDLVIRVLMVFLCFCLILATMMLFKVNLWVGLAMVVVDLILAFGWILPLTELYIGAIAHQFVEQYQANQSAAAVQSTPF